MNTQQKIRAVLEDYRNAKVTVAGETFYSPSVDQATTQLMELIHQAVREAYTEGYNACLKDSGSKLKYHRLAEEKGNG